VIPQEVYGAWDAKEAGARAESEWNKQFDAYRAKHSAEAAEFVRRMNGELPAKWAQDAKDIIEAANQKGETIATRKASQQTLDGLAAALPELLGGSADLTGSNLTNWKVSKPVRAGEGTNQIQWGNHINYGVREFGMSAIMNGIALHGGYIPYGGTFLTFSDYSRNAVRMAALMGERVVFVFTHDSIGLGEDGPTHQPIEHLAGLRLIPNNSVWRPCDAVETMIAWLAAIERRDGPTCLILSRQNLPHVDREERQLSDIRRGGYLLAEADGAPAVTLLATGSEVALAMSARAALAAHGVGARVVSMPSCSDFDAQEAAYRASVLPRAIPVLAIEAGVSRFWRAYTGFDGDVIGIDCFGESAPAAQVAEALGLTVAAVTERALALVPGARS
jgi:transketolase